MPLQESDFDSIRERIVQALETRLSTMLPDPLAADPYAFKFSAVTRSDLNADFKGKEYVVSIVDTDENFTPDINPVVRCSLSIVLDFLVYNKTRETPTRKMNKVYSEVYRRIMEDQTFGGIAIDVVFERNETEPDSQFEGHIEGSMFLTVKYRHNNLDPRARV